MSTVVVGGLATSLTLTNQDVLALRKADSIVFVHREGDGRIIASKRKPGSWAEETERRELIVDSTIDDHAAAYSYQGSSPHYNCFESITSAQYSEIWRTIAGLLKAGDVPKLRWIAANHTMTLNEAGLVEDELHLVVVRAGKRLEFFIDSRICPGDSTARMVRRA